MHGCTLVALPVVIIKGSETVQLRGMNSASAARWPMLRGLLLQKSWQEAGRQDSRCVRERIVVGSVFTVLRQYDDPVKSSGSLSQLRSTRS